MATVDENSYCPECTAIVDYVDEGQVCPECGWTNFDKTPAVTRERIRQIEAKALRKLQNKKKG